MSDKKEIKNLDNLTKIDFRKKQVEFKDDFISRSEVHSILSANFGKLVTIGSNFQLHGIIMLIKPLWTWINI